MALFILTFIFIALAALGMAVGVLFRRSELKGTCATLNGNHPHLTACEICPARHPLDACEPERCPYREAGSGRAERSTARTEA